MRGLLLFAIVGGPLEIATVIGVTVLAMNVGYRHPAGRLALAPAVLPPAALGVWLAATPADRYRRLPGGRERELPLASMPAAGAGAILRAASLREEGKVTQCATDGRSPSPAWWWAWPSSREPAAATRRPAPAPRPAAPHSKGGRSSWSGAATSTISTPPAPTTSPPTRWSGPSPASCSAIRPPPTSPRPTAPSPTSPPRSRPGPTAASAPTARPGPFTCGRGCAGTPARPAR